MTMPSRAVLQTFLGRPHTLGEVLTGQMSLPVEPMNTLMHELVSFRAL